LATGCCGRLAPADLCRSLSNSVSVTAIIAPEVAPVSRNADVVLPPNRCAATVEPKAG